MSKYKEDYDNSDGVWRTIGGRRVFIRKGQRLSDAMKESGKFRKKGEDENAENENMRMASGTRSRDVRNKTLSEKEDFINERLELKTRAEERIDKATSPEEKKRIWQEYWEEYYKVKKK